MTESLTRKIGYYITVEFVEDNNAIFFEIGPGVSTEQKNIKLVFDPKGFLKYYSNNEENHSLIFECKDFQHARKISYWFLVDIVNRINCEPSIVYEKIGEKEIPYFQGDNAWI